MNPAESPFRREPFILFASKLRAMKTHANPSEELPPVSAELVLIRALAQATAKSLPRKKRVAFLREVTDILGLSVEYGNVVRFRSAEHHDDLVVARSQAAEWWRRALSLILPSV